LRVVGAKAVVCAKTIKRVAARSWRRIFSAARAVKVATASSSESPAGVILYCVDSSLTREDVFLCFIRWSAAGIERDYWELRQPWPGAL
jgi:hypothetical protein